ncbi:MAG TPA: SDR family oxidoreductase [Blastocatellia bacterium]|nr:SDR family oxidoreductase [Blastocatellia bacterium]
MIDSEGQDQNPKRRILIAGATGYIGGRLLPALEIAGYKLRCLARQPQSVHLTCSETEVIAGDVLDRRSLTPAFEGIDTAYYLVHSMGTSGDFQNEDRLAAKNFGEAAREAGVQRIIYLGGLGESNESLSSHLRSRHEVGEILRESGVVVVELRASIVIGSGSLSFEMIRALTERLPVMIAPRWVATLTQPIAIEDLIAYLIASAELPLRENRVFEIGGADCVSYGDLMREYARQRRLRRLFISVPVLTPRLSSLWLGLVTPLYARVGRKLIESLRNQTTVVEKSAETVFDIRPRGSREAIARALLNEDLEYARTRWSDSLSSAGPQRSWAGVRFGSRIVDSRLAQVNRSPAVSFAPIRRIGGKTGWYYANWLWRLRGHIDRMFGGVGMRRGRLKDEAPTIGGMLDFWRVETYEPDRKLRLAAEMKLPGRAWLEFEVEGNTSHSTIRQTAIFDPLGVWGLLYWYALYPFHQLVFAGMLRGIVSAAGREPSRPSEGILA